MRYLTSAGLFCAGCVIGWAATLGWLHPPVDANTSASWVQAVGSIGAIFASALLLRYQADLQRKNRIRAICALVEISVEAVTKKLEIPEDFTDAFHHFASLDFSEVEYAHEALAKIPLHEIDSVEVVRQTTRATDAMRRIRLKLGSEEVVDAGHQSQRITIGRLFAGEVATLKEATKALSRLV
ncbi:hypothetical protein [Paraburkholderia sp. J12]|uniref:hypothetical protein n=1 Tax=Paraburkholderia sp. J12 TaxID=2805432 RepID=UPI002ABE30CB|nr:hypothetical protein [Paraburkholderia sp. J12]